MEITLEEYLYIELVSKWEKILQDDEEFLKSSGGL